MKHHITYTFGKASEAELSRLVFDDKGNIIVGYFGLDYTNRFGETARHKIQGGVKYGNVLKASRDELEPMLAIDYGLEIIQKNHDNGTPFELDQHRLIVVDENKATELQRAAAFNVLRSIYNSIIANASGTYNEAYTKKETYRAAQADDGKILAGLKVHRETETLELSGLSVTKKILIEGNAPIRNKRPLTIEQDKIKSRLTLSRWRTFKLDNITEIRRKGDTLFFGETVTQLAEQSGELETVKL